MNFEELFCDIPGEEYPQKRDYKGKEIFRIGKFPVTDKEKLIISIEQSNSQHTQGLGIDVYGSCKFLGKKHKKKRVFMCFWEDAQGYDPKSIEIQVMTKESFVFIQNIWEETIYEEIVFDPTKPAMESHKTVKIPEGKAVHRYVGWGKSNGAAMYSEDIPNGKRYFCNDGDEDDDFDDIIFTVKRK